MKKLLESKLSAIRLKMDKYKYVHLFWLKEDWQKLRAVETFIVDLMSEYEASLRHPLLEEIEKNWQMGFLTPYEREKKINDLQVQDNY